MGLRDSILKRKPKTRRLVSNMVVVSPGNISVTDCYHGLAKCYATLLFLFSTSKIQIENIIKYE